MRFKAVLITLAVVFVAPVFVAAAAGAETGTVRASSHDTSCRRKRAKKAEGENTKKKDKDGKKQYGFEL